MVDKSGSAPLRRGEAEMDLTEIHLAIERGLTAAGDAMRTGEMLEAERTAKAVSALIKAAREAGEVAAALVAPPEEDVEELRAELRRRLALYVEADLADAPPDVLERIALEGRA